MKRLASLLMTVCICLSASIALTACEKEHVHTPKTEWTRNDTYHWLECADETCTEISGRAPHTWNNGEITTMPSADTNGEKTFICLICGATKVVPIAFACVGEETGSTCI